MSTAATAATPRTNTPGVERRPAGGPRSWANSWAVALRIGRRDAWRNKGRTLLILAMVCLPVLLLSGAFTAWRTASLDPADEIPATMGSAQAAVMAIGAHQVRQDPSGRWDSGCSAGACPTATPLKGTTATTALAQAAPAVREYLHATDVVPLAHRSARVEAGERHRAVRVLHVDPTADAVRGMVDLRSGRWPSGPDEVVVTDVGESVGLPTTGTVTLRGERADAEEHGPATSGPEPQQSLSPVDDPGRALRVVGVASGAAGLLDHLVVADAAPSPASALLVARDTPVTWDQVKDANRHGLMIASRDVIKNPPAPQDEYDNAGFFEPSDDFPPELMTVLCTGVFLAAALLAGPAFTVVAARQRRTLAMIASNGATGAQLRRAMLGQGLVLGVGGATLGALLGITAVRPVADLLDAWRPTVAGATWTPARLGPVDVPWQQVLLVAGSAILAALVAAALPARGLADLDVVAAMRGDVAPKRARRRLPLAGLVLLAAGTALLAFQLRPGASGGLRSTVQLTAGCVALVAGALMVVPMVLVGVAALLRRAPLTVRMAARDAARQRGRATSTVAAVMAGTMLLAASLTALASWDALARATYAPQAPRGVGSVRLMDSLDTAGWRRIITAEVPDATVIALKVPARVSSDAPDARADSWTIRSPQCRPVPQTGEEGQDCAAPSLGQMNTGEVYIAEPAELQRVVRLPDRARQALADGAVVTAVPDLTGGTAVVERTSSPANADGPERTEATYRVPLVQVRTGDLAELNENGNRGHDGGVTVMSPATARRLGITATEDELLLVRAPHGIDTAAQDRINTAAADASGTYDTSGINTLDVERGYVDDLAGVRSALMAATLALIVLATVTATALAVGEARRDLRVLAVLGSRPGTPRAMAAALAAITAAVGTLAGYAVGLVPGVLWSQYGTRHPVDPRVAGSPEATTVVVPWLPLAGTLVVAVAVAALAAWLLVRPTVDVTRRAR